MSKKSRHISSADKNYLWMSSAGRCAYPDCRIELVIEGNKQDGPVTIGEIAHIFAHSQNGPRPNPDGFSEETNRYDNLLLLCRNHHREVDGQSNTYPVTVLREWKIVHEGWVAERLAREEFNSADLETIITWLTDNSIPTSTDYTLIPPAQKIELNNMSVRVQNLIKMGLSRVEEVESYIVDRSKLDPKFPERLLTPLLTQYDMLKADGLNSDLIFNDLIQFACGNSIQEPSKQSAGLVLIVYFFERCEIFER